MITLLTAVFGKDIIPENVRAVMLAVGVSVLSYRLMKIYKQHKAYKVAMQQPAMPLATQQKAATAAVAVGVANAVS